MIHKKYKTIFFITLLLLTLVYGYQSFLGATSLAEKDATQSNLLSIVRYWISTNPRQIETEVRTPIGKTSLACRSWALDYIRGNCYGLIIYSSKILEPEWKSNLIFLLQKPCDYLTSNSTLTMTIETSQCSTKNRRVIRIVVSVEKVNSFTAENGSIRNEFEVLDKFVVNGEI